MTADTACQPRHTTTKATTGTNNNPYTAQLVQCPGPKTLTKAYELHRHTRNAEKYSQLSQSLRVSPDAILHGLVLDNQPPEFDPRNCITIWARPNTPVMDLISDIQRELVQVIDPANLRTPSSSLPANTPVKSNTGPLWLMPRDCLHLSALEITHSAPSEMISSLLVSLRPHISQLLHPLPFAPLLIKPMICFDSAALALTFVPHPDEPFSYTHYRAKLFDTVESLANISVDSRYQVPSAHITIARFIDEIGPDTVKALLAKISELNEMLEASTLEWKIGTERASECRCGRIWYGGGWSEGHGLSIEEALS